MSSEDKNIEQVNDENIDESPTETENPIEQNPQDVEKQEEEKLKAKYPHAVGGRPVGGHSAFLQKRLQKGQKYFDSGDYQMAKQKTGGIKQIFANKVPTGEAIPTPESVPIRKTSIIQPCKQQPYTNSS
ncbi:cAMP-regulated phosphoprotein 19 [Chironomus tepperi]|uniref:cAMP-regulated phosphoprotein 19 n=1 Tax=Chironomus tepperi TaxID=113505 RepID=UPI00391FA080